jgi:hypothetical protein
MFSNRRAMKVAAGLAIALVAAGCGKSGQAPAAATPAPAMKPAPPTPIDVKRAEIGGPMWDPAWDKIVEDALPPPLLSSRVARDVRPFCPRFKTMIEMDKKAYWAYFFQALAGAEAGLNPTANVRQTEPEVAVKDTVTKRRAHSEGLLQLAYMDADRYGCAFDWERDKGLAEKDPAKTILQPINNLTCGVRILEDQLIEKGKPLFSRLSYWSTLQPGTASYRVFVKQMTNVPAACRLAPAGARSKGKRAGAANGTEAANKPAAGLR